MIKYRADLYQLLPDKAVVAELGCAEGYFSADILRWPNVKRLYMVDLWGTIEKQFGDGSSPQNWHDKNYHDAMDRVLFASDRVTVLRGLTWDMAPKVGSNHLDMVYLDACHTYECVLKDLETWYHTVKPSGIIAGHDYLNRSYGVFDAVQQFASRYSVIVNTIPENKNEDAGFYFIKPK